MRYGYIALNRSDGKNADVLRRKLHNIGCKVVLMDFHGSVKVNLKGLIEGLDKGDEIIAISVAYLVENPTELAVLLRDIDKAGATLTVSEDGFTSSSAVAKELIAIAEKLGVPEGLISDLDGRKNMSDRTVHHFLHSAGRPRALSEDLEKRVIDEVVGKGERQTRVAEMLNVSPSTINRIVKRHLKDHQ